MNAIGAQLRDPINSGLTRWRMAVSAAFYFVFIKQSVFWGAKSKKRGSGNNRVYRNLNAGYFPGQSL